MNRNHLLQVLTDWDRRERCVYTLGDLARLFPEDAPATLQAGVERQVRAGVLKRACRGVYVYPLGRSFGADVIERVAAALRRSEYNYVSLESALSEYSIISQVPFSLTVMTTGRGSSIRTRYGAIEFTHTERSGDSILSSTVEIGRPLRLAKPLAAVRDLRRVGRNTQLIDEEFLLEEYAG